MRISRVVGAGGFSTVYEAMRVSDRRRIAVKIANSPAADALDREREALQAIGPPAVPGVLGSGHLDGRPYLILELVTMPTLAASRGPFASTRIAELARPFLAALRSVHEAGWLHLDLTPGNIASSPSRAVLLDLGSARKRGAVANGAAFCGTAEYMSPEQCAGGTLSVESDVYSAGVVLFELATGRVPFEGREREIHQDHASRRPPRPSSLAAVSPALEDVLLRCLAKDPRDRFPSASTLARALTVAARQPGSTRRSRAHPAGNARRRSRRQVATLSLRTHASPHALFEATRKTGALLACVDGGRCVFVFEDVSCSCPIRRATRAARRLIDTGLGHAALVDAGELVYTTRVDGSRRYFGPFHQHVAEDEDGVLLTEAAASCVRDGRATPAGRAGRFRLDEDDDARVPAPFGRAAVVAALRAMLEQPDPSFVSVIGDPGTGRSHLARHLSDLAAIDDPDTEVWRIRGLGGTAFQTLLRRAGRSEDDYEAVLSVTGDLPDEERRAAQSALLAQLGRDAPEFARPDIGRSIAVQALGRALRRMAMLVPVVVVVDDAELADEVTLDALEYAGLAEAGANLRVFAFGTPGFAAVRPTFGRRAARSETLTLGRLDAQSAREMCRSLLLPADPVPAEVLDRLASMANGVPRDLVDLVAALKRDGFLHRGASGAWQVRADRIEHLPPFPSAGWLAEREIRILPPDVAELAEIAALLFEPFDAEQLAGVVSEMERDGRMVIAVDIAVGLRRLVSVNIVREQDDGFALRHALLREAIGSRMEPERRRAIHRAAAAWWQRKDGPRALRRYAHHLAESGEAPAQAATAFLRVGERSLALHALLDADVAFSRSLALALSDPAEEVRARRGRSVARHRTGRLEDALEDLRSARLALDATRRPLEEIEIVLDEATILDWANRHEEAAVLIEQASRRASDAPPLLQSRIEMALGRAALRAERWDEAASRLTAAADRADGCGTAGYETRIVSLLLLGAVLPQLGRIMDAEAAFEIVTAETRRAGDRLHLASALNNLRNLRIARTDLAGALCDLSTSKTIGRELGMAGIEYVAEYNTAELLYQASDIEAATLAAARARAIEERHPEVCPRSLASLLFARIHVLEGRLEDARVSLAAYRPRSDGAPASESILADMVALSTDRAPLEDWEPLLERSAAESIEQEAIEVAELAAIAAVRAGRRDRARRWFDRAIDLCRSTPNIMTGRVHASKRLLDETGPLWCFATSRSEAAQAEPLDIATKPIRHEG